MSDELPLRRILVIPQIGLSSTMSDSSFQLMHDIVSTASRTRPELYFYMVVPDWAKDMPEPPSNCHRIVLPLNRDWWFNDMVGVGSHQFAELFHRRGGKYVIDALYCEQVSSAYYMGQWLSDHRTKHSLPVFFSDPIWIPEWLKWTIEQKLGCMLAYATSYAFFNVPGHRTEMAGLLSKWFKPNVVDMIQERHMIVPPALDMKMFDRITEENPKHEKVSLFCGMRFNTIKNIPFIMDVFSTLYSYGRDIYVCSTTGTEEGRAQNVMVDDRSFFKHLSFSTPRDEYLKQAARCHVFLSASVGETFALHIVEQLLMGLVGVVPDSEWVWQCLPRDYPFKYRYKDKQEAYTVTAWVMDNLEKAREMIRPHVEWLRKEYSSEHAVEVLMGHIGKVIDERYVDHSARDVSFLNKGFFRMPLRLEIVEAASSLGDSFTMSQLLSTIKFTGTDSRIITKLGAPRQGIPTMYDIRMILHSFGWYDAHDGPEIRFVRSPRARSPLESYREQIEEAKRMSLDAPKGGSGVEESDDGDADGL